MHRVEVSIRKVPHLVPTPWDNLKLECGWLKPYSMYWGSVIFIEINGVLFIYLFYSFYFLFCNCVQDKYLSYRKFLLPDSNTISSATKFYVTDIKTCTQIMYLWILFLFDVIFCPDFNQKSKYVGVYDTWVCKYCHISKYFKQIEKQNPFCISHKLHNQFINQRYDLWLVKKSLKWAKSSFYWFFEINVLLICDRGFKVSWTSSGGFCILVHPFKSGEWTYCWKGVTIAVLVFQPGALVNISVIGDLPWSHAKLHTPTVQCSNSNST